MAIWFSFYSSFISGYYTITASSCICRNDIAANNIQSIHLAGNYYWCAGADAGCALTKEALDFVARHSAQTGYLVGDRFSVADLTAAAILQPTCLPPEYPVVVPEPRPAGWQRWLDRWHDHAGCDYVRRMYREHRSVSAAIAD